MIDDDKKLQRERKKTCFLSTGRAFPFAPDAISSTQSFASDRDFRFSTLVTERVAEDGNCYRWFRKKKKFS